MEIKVGSSKRIKTFGAFFPTSSQGLCWNIDEELHSSSRQTAAKSTVPNEINNAGYIQDLRLDAVPEISMTAGAAGVKALNTAADPLQGLHHRELDEIDFHSGSSGKTSVYPARQLDEFNGELADDDDDDDDLLISETSVDDVEIGPDIGNLGGQMLHHELECEVSSSLQVLISLGFNPSKSYSVTQSISDGNATRIENSSHDSLERFTAVERYWGTEMENEIPNVPSLESSTRPPETSNNKSVSNIQVQWDSLKSVFKSGQLKKVPDSGFAKEEDPLSLAGFTKIAEREAPLQTFSFGFFPLPDQLHSGGSAVENVKVRISLSVGFGCFNFLFLLGTVTVFICF
jgi:hypothetical protein